MGIALRSAGMSWRQRERVKKAGKIDNIFIFEVMNALREMTFIYIFNRLMDGNCANARTTT